MMNLFSVLVVFQEKATFRNLSRYYEMHEKRFSRGYRRRFDFALLNLCLVDHELEKGAERIAAIDRISASRGYNANRRRELSKKTSCKIKRISRPG